MWHIGWWRWRANQRSAPSGGAEGAKCYQWRLEVLRKAVVRFVHEDFADDRVEGAILCD